MKNPTADVVADALWDAIVERGFDDNNGDFQLAVVPIIQPLLDRAENAEEKIQYCDQSAKDAARESYDDLARLVVPAGKVDDWNAQTELILECLVKMISPFVLQLAFKVMQCHKAEIERDELCTEVEKLKSDVHLLNQTCNDLEQEI